MQMNPGLSRFRGGALLLVLMAVTGVVLISGSHRASATPSRSSGRTATTAATSAIGFSHAVVVDEQRPGFEPDVKVAPDGHIFTSIPFGFSTTQSFVWSSRDGGNSYQLTPGNIGPGKPTTCAGGGDTDLFIDPQGALYFSDLQGLTNISNSASQDEGATWSTNCAGAPNTPDDRMWFTGTGSLAKGDLTLYQDFDAVESSASSSAVGGNQLVETVSHDGTTFQPVINTNSPSDCPGANLQDCVTDNEGISGNQVTDPATGNVFIAHTTTENGPGSEVGVRVSEGKITQGSPTTATWTESPNLDAALCADPTCVDANGNAEELAGENFASIARDSAGYLYVTFTAGPLDHASSNDPNFGALTQPEQIYVVHSLEPAGSDPSKITWSAPQRISGEGLSAGTNTFPWITAGADGRVDVAWYHTDSTSQQGTCASGSGTCNLYGASSLTKAEWSVQLGQSLDANSTTPTYTAAAVSEAPVKYGQICTNGIGCTTGGDRSLGDFLQVSIDNQGAAVVSYVDDTSQDVNDGEDAGPEVISRQISGPSLLSGDVTQGSGPGVPFGSVTDPTGDADYSANGTRTPDMTGNLDLTGASLANGPGNTLVATIKVKNLSTLTPDSGLGGSDASWIIRWTQVRPGQPGNGDIYYAGMDNNGGSTPTFFTGDTGAIPPPGNQAEHTKYITYPQTTPLSASQASYDAKAGTITMKIPRADVGNPADGTTLYSVTAFTATSNTPQSETTIFNLIDATPPFDLTVGAPGTTGAPTTTNPSSGSGSGSGGGVKPAAGGAVKIFGRTAFVSPGGIGGVFVGCFVSRAACAGSLRLAVGREAKTVIASRGAFSIGSGAGGIVHLSLTRKGRSLLARARDHHLAVTATLSAGGKSQTVQMTLVEFFSRVPAIRSNRSGLPALRSFGHTAFASGGGVVGVFAGCFATSTCTGSLTLYNHGVLVASRFGLRIPAEGGGIVHMALSRVAQAQLAKHGTLVVQLRLRGAKGQLQTANLMIVHFT
jgi:hypothetical protein